MKIHRIDHVGIIVNDPPVETRRSGGFIIIYHDFPKTIVQEPNDV
ncbi:hypothetical protein J14TS5_47970 [Paenibacillus lautus]|nr:hypothetical protein [Paenibacillus lautus]GIO99711.1 hypothetical protein J14TS5_47970 [Paenibacillus lautus]